MTAMKHDVSTIESHLRATGWREEVSHEWVKGDDSIHLGYATDPVGVIAAVEDRPREAVEASLRHAARTAWKLGLRAGFACAGMSPDMVDAKAYRRGYDRGRELWREEVRRLEEDQETAWEEASHG